MLSTAIHRLRPYEGAILLQNVVEVFIEERWIFTAEYRTIVKTKKAEERLYFIVV
jgi:hypothetical protein|tara:strand:- start:15021 stop:15185 length:165 start_codon:yes stop_codon:yes gene_type:complete